MFVFLYNFWTRLFKKFPIIFQGKNDFVQLMVNAQAGDDIREAADKEDTDADSQTKSPPKGRGVFYLINLQIDWSYISK